MTEFRRASVGQQPAKTIVFSCDVNTRASQEAALSRMYLPALFAENWRISVGKQVAAGSWQLTASKEASEGQVRQTAKDALVK